MAMNGMVDIIQLTGTCMSCLMMHIVGDSGVQKKGKIMPSVCIDSACTGSYYSCSSTSVKPSVVLLELDIFFRFLNILS